MPQSHNAQASATATSSMSSSGMAPGRREACSGWLTATRGDEGSQAQGSSSTGSSGAGGKKVYHHSHHH